MSPGGLTLFEIGLIESDILSRSIYMPYDGERALSILWPSFDKDVFMLRTVSPEKYFI